MKYKIGIDGGGSKTHAVIFSHDKSHCVQIYEGACNINNDVETAYNSIEKSIHQLCQKSNISIDAVSGIGIGVAGYSNSKNLAYLDKKLKNLHPNIVIRPDCVIAHLAAFGFSEGAIVICGTGVSAYYKEHTTMAQIGGWGFPHGDLGGGAFLGLELCRVLCSALDGATTFTPLLDDLYSKFANSQVAYKEWLLGAKAQDFASLTPYLVNHPKDTHAKAIIGLGCAHLIALIASLTQKMPNLEIKLYGGLANFYLPHLIHKFPKLEVCTNTAAIGALLLVVDK